MPTYKLYYFPTRGRAEPTRLALAYGGIEYDDIRFGWEEWQEYQKEAPFGHAPYLKIDDTIIADSAAIMRYVSKIAGLVPDSSIEEAQANMITGGIKDIQEKMIYFIYVEKDETKKEEQKKNFFEKILPKFLCNLDRIVKNCGGSSFLVGKKISFADVEFFNVCNSWIGKGKREAPECLNDHPELVRVYEEVATNTNIAAWLEKRPKSDMP